MENSKRLIHKRWFEADRKYMDKKHWNNKLQELRKIIHIPEYTEISKELIFELHKEVHVSKAYNSQNESYEDLIWNDFNENLFRTATDEKGRTVLYGIWHSARIEDITMNLLVANNEQIFETGNWQSKINTPIKHTGNSLHKEEILDFSKGIDIQALKDYRIEVGKRTLEIICNLQKGQLNDKIYKKNLAVILEQKAVEDVESANWLIDFWGRKTVSGIILMPALRHNLVHINESQNIIKKNNS